MPFWLLVTFENVAVAFLAKSATFDELDTTADEAVAILASLVLDAP